MKHIKLFEQFNNTYKELEFMCHNSLSKDSTTKENQRNLFNELKKLKEKDFDVFPYMQDFSDGNHDEISLSVIILNKNKEADLEKEILKLAKECNIDFDLYKERSNKEVDSIIRGDFYENMITENFKNEYKSFKELSDDDLYNIALEGLSKEYSDSGVFDATDNIEEAAKIIVEEDFKYVLNDNFPSGFKIFPSKPVLFRFISAENKESININKIGYSWFADKSKINSEFFICLDHLTKDKPKNHKLFLVSAIINEKDIDIPRTLWQRSTQYRENEIVLKNDKDIIVTKIEEVNKTYKHEKI